MTLPGLALPMGRVAVAVGAHTPKNIAGASSASVKNGAGTLYSLVINTFAAAGTITVYDSLSASGTKLLTITEPATLLGQGPVTALYHVAFATGLFVVTVGAAWDITLAYA